MYYFDHFLPYAKIEYFKIVASYIGFHNIIFLLLQYSRIKEQIEL